MFHSFGGHLVYQHHSKQTQKVTYFKKVKLIAQIICANLVSLIQKVVQGLILEKLQNKCTKLAK